MIMYSIHILEQTEQAAQTGGTVSRALKVANEIAREYEFGSKVTTFTDLVGYVRKVHFLNEHGESMGHDELSKIGSESLLQAYACVEVAHNLSNGGIQFVDYRVNEVQLVP